MEYVNVEVRLNKQLVDFLDKLASTSGVSRDGVASVLFSLGMPSISPDATQRKPDAVGGTRRKSKLNRRSKRG